jgi:hypothetical protein
MVSFSRYASVYDETSSDIPSGYGIEHHPRDGWYAYRVSEYPGLCMVYLKDEQGLDRLFASREAAVCAVRKEAGLGCLNES